MAVTRRDQGPPLVLTWLRMVRNTNLSLGAKALAAMLVTYANPDGTSCRPGDSRLQEDLAGSTDRSIRRWRAELVCAGLLTCARRSAGDIAGTGAGWPAEWRLTLPDVGPQSPTSDMSRRTPESAT
jgi:hypothetical protein